MTIEGNTVPWLVLFVLVCLTLTGAGVVAWGAWRALAAVWEWVSRDRVTPLLEDEHPGDPGEAGESLLRLPPARSWEQMTHHQLPIVGMGPAERKHWRRLERGRERRATTAESFHRAQYAALDLEYPSGLMARVREAAQ